jgi:hypothetical protein
VIDHVGEPMIPAATLAAAPSAAYKGPMELIGIEFDGYASFSTRYVPLSKGINLLVGRNNAGKMALLRGRYLTQSRVDKRRSAILNSTPPYETASN